MRGSSKTSSSTRMLVSQHNAGGVQPQELKVLSPEATWRGCAVSAQPYGWYKKRTTETVCQADNTFLSSGFFLKKKKQLQNVLSTWETLCVVHPFLVLFQKLAIRPASVEGSYWKKSVFVQCILMGGWKECVRIQYHSKRNPCIHLACVDVGILWVIFVQPTGWTNKKLSIPSLSL